MHRDGQAGKNLSAGRAGRGGADEQNAVGVGDKRDEPSLPAL